MTDYDDEYDYEFDQNESNNNKDVIIVKKTSNNISDAFI